ncbi:MAG: FtsQ-type POTRA domain-containing protein [Proteobacteria bacterium]|nr:FtsQ-type POTRA domain-containing protein [Pseudomonadota bacterium]MBI3496576.1 FtsQ-type POTRA domain-containing protein [Pseudomonadota bacterium]
MRFMIRDPAQAKPRRRRVALRWLKPSLIGLLAVAAAAGAAFGAQSLWGSGAFDRLQGQAAESALRMTAAFGLRVEEVLLEGRRETAAKDVLAALDVQRGQPILAVSPEAARRRLERLAWVKSAVVERALPGTLRVRLTERTPMALWQRDRKLVLVDRDGVVILRGGIERFASLPVLVGDDAPPAAAELLDLLASEPMLQKRVVAAIRVAERRWNLQLDNGVDVRLPETDIAQAWAQLANLERTSNVLQRDVVTIDLRLPDRLVIQVSPEGAKQRTRGNGKAT